MVKIPQLWQTVKEILGDKSRGAKLMTVGVLLVGAGEISDIVRGVLQISREGSNTFIFWESWHFLGCNILCLWLGRTKGLKLNNINIGLL